LSTGLQALVLAGGQGTRLLPLTHTTPKPVMPLAGRPFLTFMLDWLSGHGVTEVILSCGFMSESVHDVLGDIYEGLRLRYVIEEEPLGTAGPVRLALDEGVLAERLLVLNGDVLTDMDLTGELAQHQRTRARATLALVAVQDTASYGVVPTDPEGRVEAFLEKSEGPAPTNRINAGAYVIERDVIETAVPAGRAVSFEREVFPQLVGSGLYGWAAGGYWIDIGTPERYLEATYDLLSGRPESKLRPRDETGSLIGEGCLTAGAHIGPQSVLGTHCSVGSDSTVERSVLHDRVRIGADCHVRGSVLADRVHVGDGARIEPGALVGANARVGEGAVVAADARIDPGVAVQPGERVA
jgi:mannose-1-phosphate guanylyltransferase